MGIYKDLAQLEGKLKGLLGDTYFGKGELVDPVEFYSTGCLALDYVMGGGLPKGRVVEISGVESSGKNAVIYQIISSLQSQGKNVAFIDLENSFDVTFASYCGVDCKDLICVVPESAEKTFECILMLVNSGMFSAIAVDSVAALCPQDERATPMADTPPATTAMLLSKFFKKVVQPAAKTGTSLIFLNQLRSTLNKKGAQEETTGGKAIRYYSSTRLRTRQVERLKEVTSFIGIRSEIETIKTKVGLPFRKAQFNIYFPYTNEDGEIVAGIDPYVDLIEYSLASGLLTRKGSFIYLPDGTPFQGIKKLKAYLRSNPKTFSELKSSIEIPTYLAS